MVEHWKENGPPAYIAAALKWGFVDGKGNKGSKAKKIDQVDANENERNLMSLAADLSGSGGVFNG